MRILIEAIERVESGASETREEYAAQVEQMKLDAAVDRSLVAAKVKNAKAVPCPLDMGAVKLDGETISGLDERIEALKTSDGYLFEQDAQITGIPPKRRRSRTEKQYRTTY